MEKQVVKLTESQIREIVTESVYNVLKESEMDEGFLDNLKAGWNGAKQGYNYQKAMDRGYRYQSSADLFLYRCCILPFYRYIR